MKYESNAQIPIEAAVLAPQSIPMGGGGEAQVAGQALMGFGQKLYEIKKARETAKGIAQYNEIVGEYINSLETKDPNEYDFVQGFKSLQGKIESIYKGKSRGAVEDIKNHLVVWNETNQVNIAKMSVDKSIYLAKLETQAAVENAILNNQPESAVLIINKFVEANLYSKEQGQLYKNDLIKTIAENQYKDIILSYRQQAFSAPDEKTAQKIIDDSTGVLEKADRNDLLAQVKRHFEQREEDIEDNQEENYKDYLTKVWNRELDDVMVIRQAFVDDLISEKQKDTLEQEILNPVKKTDPATNSTIKEAIVDYGRGQKTKEEVEKLISNNLQKISNEDKLNYSNEMSRERKSHIDDLTSTGYSILKNSIGDPDPLTGLSMLISSSQQAGYNRGLIIFDDWLNDEIEQGRFPSQRDLRIKALVIGEQIKKEITNNEIEPTLSGMRKTSEGGAFPEPGNWILSSKNFRVENGKKVLTRDGLIILARKFNGVKEDIEKYAEMNDWIIP
jgi:hypothetical protein